MKIACQCDYVCESPIIHNIMIFYSLNSVSLYSNMVIVGKWLLGILRALWIMQSIEVTFPIRMYCVKSIFNHHFTELDCKCEFKQEYVQLLFFLRRWKSFKESLSSAVTRLCVSKTSQVDTCGHKCPGIPMAPSHDLFLPSSTLMGHKWESICYLWTHLCHKIRPNNEWGNKVARAWFRH